MVAAALAQASQSPTVGGDAVMLPMKKELSRNIIVAYMATPVVL